MKVMKFYEVVDGVVIYVYDDGKLLYASPVQAYIDYDGIIDIAQHGFKSEIKGEMETPLYTPVITITRG